MKKNRGNIATKTTETFIDKITNISLIIKESLRDKIKVCQLLLYCKKKRELSFQNDRKVSFLETNETKLVEKLGKVSPDLCPAC